MELNGLSERARKLIESCGYGKPHFMSEDDVAERQAFFEEEGYTVSDEAKEIIDNFYMLSIGKHGTFKDGTFVITENDDIENKLVVYPENIYDAAHLFKQLSDAVGDYIIPLGLINNDFIAIGSSGKIYIIGDDVYVGRGKGDHLGCGDLRKPTQLQRFDALQGFFDRDGRKTVAYLYDLPSWTCRD